MDAQPIEKIMKRYKDQWLLIRVIRFDRKRTLPLTGRLLAHSKDRDEIYEEMGKHKGLKLVTHSNPQLPEGYAAVL